MDIILFYVYAIAICNNVKSASNNVAISPTPEAKAAIPKITAHKQATCSTDNLGASPLLYLEYYYYILKSQLTLL